MHWNLQSVNYAYSWSLPMSLCSPCGCRMCTATQRRYGKNQHRIGVMKTKSLSSLYLHRSLTMLSLRSSPSRARPSCALFARCSVDCMVCEWWSVSFLLFGAVPLCVCASVYFLFSPYGIQSALWPIFQSVGSSYWLHPVGFYDSVVPF